MSGKLCEGANCVLCQSPRGFTGLNPLALHQATHQCPATAQTLPLGAVKCLVLQLLDQLAWLDKVLLLLGTDLALDRFGHK